MCGVTGQLSNSARLLGPLCRKTCPNDRYVSRYTWVLVRAFPVKDVNKCAVGWGGKRSTFSEMAGGVRSQIGDVTDSLLASTAAGFPYSGKNRNTCGSFCSNHHIWWGGDDPVLRDRFNVAIRCSTLKMLGSFPRVLAQISPCKVKMK